MSTNKKIISLVVIVLVLVAVGVSAVLLFGKNIPSKQPAPKVYKIGILNGFDYVGKNTDGFIAGMTELGYIEGKNILQAVEVVLNCFTKQTLRIRCKPECFGCSAKERSVDTRISNFHFQNPTVFAKLIRNL